MCFFGQSVTIYTLNWWSLSSYFESQEMIEVIFSYSSIIGPSSNLFPLVHYESSLTTQTRERPMWQWAQDTRLTPSSNPYWQSKCKESGISWHGSKSIFGWGEPPSNASCHELISFAEIAFGLINSNLLAPRLTDQLGPIEAGLINGETPVMNNLCTSDGLLVINAHQTQGLITSHALGNQYGSKERISWQESSSNICRSQFGLQSAVSGRSASFFSTAFSRICLPSNLRENTVCLSRKVYDMVTREDVFLCRVCLVNCGGSLGYHWVHMERSGEEKR